MFFLFFLVPDFHFSFFFYLFFSLLVFIGLRVDIESSLSQLLFRNILLASTSCLFSAFRFFFVVLSFSFFLTVVVCFLLFVLSLPFVSFLRSSYSCKFVKRNSFFVICQSSFETLYCFLYVSNLFIITVS